MENPYCSCKLTRERMQEYTPVSSWEDWEQGSLSLLVKTYQAGTVSRKFGADHSRAIRQNTCRRQCGGAAGADLIRAAGSSGEPSNRCPLGALRVHTAVQRSSGRPPPTAAWKSSPAGCWSPPLR